MSSVHCVSFSIDDCHPSAVIQEQEATSSFLVYFVNFDLNIPKFFPNIDSLGIKKVSNILILKVEDGFEFRLDHVDVFDHVMKVLASKLCVLRVPDQNGKFFRMHKFAILALLC